MKNSEKIKELESLGFQDEQTQEEIQGLKEYTKGVCFWCEEVYDLEELYHTNLEGCLCQHCIEAIRSRGEKVKVGESFYYCEDEIQAMDEEE